MCTRRGTEEPMSPQRQRTFLRMRPKIVRGRLPAGHAFMGSAA